MLPADLGWAPGIGDPTVGGWVTVAAYFATAWLCLRAARCVAARNRRLGLQRRSLVVLWTVMVVVFVALGINKQLDLQSLVTAVGRLMARQEGWYEQRRLVQALFVAAIGCAGLAFLGWLLIQARDHGHAPRIALVGAVVLGCFVMIRALSFYVVDELIGFRVFDLRMNWILELGGISIVAAGAWLQSRAETETRGTAEAVPPPVGTR